MAKGIFLLTLGTALLLIGVQVFTMAEGFLKIESMVVIEGLKRTHNVLDSTTADIAAICGDYARWDDCYAFMSSGNREFLEVNFTGDSIDSLNLDLILFYGANGKLLAKLQSSKNTAEITLPQALSADNPLFRVGDSVQGYGMIGGKLYALAAHSSTMTDGSPPPRGRVIFARLVDRAFEQRISVLTALDIRITSGPLTGQPEIEVPTITRGALRAPVTGTIYHRGIEPGTALKIESSQPRTILQFGHRSILLLVLLLVVIFTMTYLSIRVTTRAIFIRPIEQLEQSLDGFDQELERLGARKDTVGRMARLVKTANEEIARNLKLQERTTEELESQVAKRTEELSEVNTALSIYKHIMEETSEGVIVTDLGSIITEANRAISMMTGYSREELLGVKPFFLINDHQEKPILEYLESEVLEKGIWEGELWVSSKAGTSFPVWLTINLITDNRGRPEHIAGIFADISRIKEAEANLNRLAFFDTLTSLPNRSLFNDRFAQALSRAQRNQNMLALLYLDLDHFKLVNDSWGHQAGDMVLVETGKRLLKQVRATDTVCRLGGDEFTIILEQISRPEDARRVAEKIVVALKQPFSLGETSIELGTSIGIALYPENATDFDELVRLADSAMYTAKQMGRGQYNFTNGNLLST